MIFYGDNANKDLSEKVAHLLGVETFYPEIHVFPDGEKRVRIQQDVLGEEVVVLKSLFMPVDENIMTFAFILDALKRRGVKSISTVVPYVGYCRGDHEFRTGEAVPLEVVIRLIEMSGAQRIAFFDPHSIKFPEMFQIPATALSAVELFAQKIKEIEPNKDNITLITPDMGGKRRLQLLSDHLGGVNCASIQKERDLHTGQIEIRQSKGEFRGTCFIIDDMIATGGTVAQAAIHLSEKGVKDIYLMATHGLLYGNALEVLKKSPARKVIVTDAVGIPEEKKFDRLEILTLASVVARYVKSL